MYQINQKECVLRNFVFKGQSFGCFHMDHAEARHAVAGDSQAIFTLDTQWLQGSHGRRAVVHTRRPWDTALWLGAGLTQSHDRYV